MQHKTQHPVQFEITQATREAVQMWINQAGQRRVASNRPSRSKSSCRLIKRSRVDPSSLVEAVRAELPLWKLLVTDEGRRAAPTRNFDFGLLRPTAGHLCFQALTLGKRIMHIDATTHEHGKSAKVYNYEGDFDVGDDAITWKASVSQGGVDLGTFTGSIPLTSPAVAALAEEGVRDEIVRRIDAFDDNRGATTGGVNV